MKKLCFCVQPCHCGCNFSKPCTCSSTVVTKYQKRISGPLLDRIYIHNIHIEMPEVDYEKLCGNRTGESSASIREWVQAARERKRDCFEGSDIACNSDMRVAVGFRYNWRSRIDFGITELMIVCPSETLLIHLSFLHVINATTIDIFSQANIIASNEF